MSVNCEIIHIPRRKRITSATKGNVERAWDKYQGLCIEARERPECRDNAMHKAIVRKAGERFDELYRRWCDK